MVHHGLLLVVAACFVTNVSVRPAIAESAEQRASRAQAFEAAYKAIDPGDTASAQKFRELVAKEFKASTPVDELLGFLIDSGLDCERIRLVNLPEFQPPVKYYCSYSFVSKEEADRLAWTSISKVSRIDMTIRIDENRMVTKIEAGTRFGLTGP